MVYIFLIVILVLLLYYTIIILLLVLKVLLSRYSHLKTDIHTFICTFIIIHDQNLTPK